MTVLNGSEAITYFKEIRNPADRPDLIITDIMMPVMDGFAPVSYTHLDVYKRQTLDQYYTNQKSKYQ